ncbi:hypothetical protein IFR05_008684 [Cadophora sp. M221]|nr:hypothetical protein IFR05_008684 [Cadophora sp. M221]
MASSIQNEGLAQHVLPPAENQVLVLDQTSEPPKPRDISADFNYYGGPPESGPPTPYYVDRPQRYGVTPITQRLTVHDVREQEDQYTLDSTGFDFYTHTSAEKDFVDDEKIRSVYYPETEELLKKCKYQHRALFLSLLAAHIPARTGAPKVHIAGHTVRGQPLDSRSNTIPKITAQEATDSPTIVPATRSSPGPVKRVHIDLSYAGAFGYAAYHLPGEAETLLKGRFQVINVWCLIKTVLKDPLAVTSANSVFDDELVPVKSIHTHREGEACSVRPAAEERTDGGHKWHYPFKQTPGEVMLIKVFDSKTDGRARRVPHSAFVDEDFVSEDLRESIEVRALVFHPEDTE